MSIEFEDLARSTLSPDFAQIKMRSTLHKALETERQAWLAAGMDEADIFRIHYGYDNADDRENYEYPGDFTVWRKEISHTRPDHKYIGRRVSLYDKITDDAFISDLIRDIRDEYKIARLRLDLERALNSLTEIQRYCFLEVRVRERTYDDLARERERHISTIQEAVRGARKKLKKFFPRTYFD
jgi:hypothetical protein